MTGLKEQEPSQLKWHELPDFARVMLDRKLEGLYGTANVESLFDSLAVDKQQALLILLRRFLALKLWDTVNRIDNLYGEGGVGMSFTAWPFIKSTLLRRRDFTSWFARHRNTAGGFIERSPGRASLHLLYRDKGARRWEAHFDLYNPWSSPLNAWRHLLHEKISGQTPDWRVVGSALGYLDQNQTISIN